MTAHDQTVRDILAARGVPAEEIELAAAHGRLQVLAVTSAAVPQERIYTAADLAEHSGMERTQADRFWRALGFPDAGEERVFTEEDAEALSIVKALIDVGFTDTEVALQMTRVFGSSLARVAEAEIQVSTLRAQDPAVAELSAMAAPGFLKTQGWLLEYVWRRHLEAAGRRLILGASAPGQGNPLTVGFADLVGFTALSQQLPQDDLARVVARFEEVAYDVVTAYGGRVAKMIGDEVMFVVEGARAGVEIGIALAEAYASDAMLSDVRVGLASGSVLARDGDYFGPVVNLASRIVGIAFPGSVVAADDVRAELAGDSAFAWRRIRPRYLKDIGRVQLWHVGRAGAETEAARESERRRRARSGRLVPELQRLAAVGRDFVGVDDESR